MSRCRSMGLSRWMLALVRGGPITSRVSLELVLPRWLMRGLRALSLHIRGGRMALMGRRSCRLPCWMRGPVRLVPGTVRWHVLAGWLPWWLVFLRPVRRAIALYREGTQTTLSDRRGRRFLGRRHWFGAAGPMVWVRLRPRRLGAGSWGGHQTGIERAAPFGRLSALFPQSGLQSPGRIRRLVRALLRIARSNRFRLGDTIGDRWRHRLLRRRNHLLGRRNRAGWSGRGRLRLLRDRRGPLGRCRLGIRHLRVWLRDGGLCGMTFRSSRRARGLFHPPARVSQDFVCAAQT